MCVCACIESHRIIITHTHTHIYIYIYYANTWSFAPEASACSLNVWACQSACRTIRCKPSACGLPPNGTLTHDFQQGAEKKTMELWWIVCSFCLNMCGGEKNQLQESSGDCQWRWVLQPAAARLACRLRHGTCHQDFGTSVDQRCCRLPWRFIEHVARKGRTPEKV